MLGGNDSTIVSMAWIIEESSWWGEIPLHGAMFNPQVYVEDRSRYSLETGTEKPARYDWGCHTLHLSQWNQHGFEQIRIPINSWVEHIPIQMAWMAFQRETSYSIRKGSRTYAWRWQPMITMVFVELDPLISLKWTSWNIYFIVYCRLYILFLYIYIIL